MIGRTTTYTAALLLSVLPGTGCVSEDPPTASRVVVSPATAAVALGESVQLTAQIADQYGAAFDGVLSWNSEALAVATVSPNGMVTGAAIGTAVVIATHGSISDTAIVTVTDRAAPVVSFRNLAPNTPVRGVTPVQVDVQDDDSVVSVALFLDGAIVDSLRAPPWEFRLDTRRVAGGAHAIRVSARDRSGNVGTTFSEEVIVRNAPASLDSWVSLPDMPIAVRSAAVASDGQHVYVAGGSTASGRTRALQVLDLATNRWSMGESLPTAVDWATATWAGGRLHLIGGVSAGGFMDQHLVYEAGRWTISTPLPRPLAGTTSGATTSSIFVFGGNSGASPAHTTTTWVFDLLTRRWTTGSPVPGARINWSGTATGGHFYLGGGGLPGLGTSADFLTYHPASDQWQRLADLPVAREAHATGALGGLVCVIGGRRARSGNFGAPTNDVSCYDPERSGWRPGPALPQSLQEVNAVSVGDEIIVVGGADARSSPVSTVYRLRLTPPRLRTP